MKSETIYLEYFEDKYASDLVDKMNRIISEIGQDACVSVYNEPESEHDSGGLSMCIYKLEDED